VMIPNADEDVQKLVFANIAGENIKMVDPL
jgi:hypothetical protein